MKKLKLHQRLLIKLASRILKRYSAIEISLSTPLIFGRNQYKITNISHTTDYDNKSTVQIDSEETNQYLDSVSLRKGRY